jgi:hypothetical protein
MSVNFEVGGNTFHSMHTSNINNSEKFLLRLSLVNSYLLNVTSGTDISKAINTLTQCKQISRAKQSHRCECNIKNKVVNGNKAK